MKKNLIQAILKKVWVIVQFVALAWLSTSLIVWSDDLHQSNQLTDTRVFVIVLLTLPQLGFFIWYAVQQGLLKNESFSWRLIKTSLCGLLILLLGNPLLHALLDLMGLGIETTANQQEILALIGSYPPVLLFIQSVLVAPILEEILFRGILGELLCGKSFLAYLIPTTLFALAHRPTDIGSFAAYFWPALVFSYLYRSTGRLEVPMLTHLLMNGLAFTVAYLVHYGILVV